MDFTLFLSICNVLEILLYPTPDCHHSTVRSYTSLTRNIYCVCVCVCKVNWNTFPCSSMFPGQSHVTLTLCTLCECKVTQSRRPWHTLATAHKTHFLFLPVACYPITRALCVRYSESWGPDTSQSHTSVIYGSCSLTKIKSHVQEWNIALHRRSERENALQVWPEGEGKWAESIFHQAAH